MRQLIKNIMVIIIYTYVLSTDQSKWNKNNFKTAYFLNKPAKETLISQLINNLKIIHA